MHLLQVANFSKFLWISCQQSCNNEECHCDVVDTTSSHYHYSCQLCKNQNGVVNRFLSHAMMAQFTYLHPQPQPCHPLTFQPLLSNANLNPNQKHSTPGQQWMLGWSLVMSCCAQLTSYWQIVPPVNSGRYSCQKGSRHASEGSLRKKQGFASSNGHPRRISQMLILFLHHWFQALLPNFIYFNANASGFPAITAVDP